MGKGKLLVTSNFSFSHSVFYPPGELSGIFIKFEIVVCKLFQFGRDLNLSFGKGLTLFLNQLRASQGPFIGHCRSQMRLHKTCSLIFNLQYSIRYFLYGENNFKIALFTFLSGLAIQKPCYF